MCWLSYQQSSTARAFTLFCWTTAIKGIKHFGGPSLSSGYDTVMHTESVMRFFSVDVSLPSVYFNQAAHAFWRRSNSTLNSGWYIFGAAHTEASLWNRTVIWTPPATSWHRTRAANQRLAASRGLPARAASVVFPTVPVPQQSRFSPLIVVTEILPSFRCDTIFCWLRSGKNLYQGEPYAMICWYIHNWQAASPPAFSGMDRCWCLVPGLVSRNMFAPVEVHARSLPLAFFGRVALARITGSPPFSPSSRLCARDDHLFRNRALPYNGLSAFQQLDQWQRVYVTTP